MAVSRWLSVSFLVSMVAGGIPQVARGIPSISEFFPEIEDDLKKVVWGHAINSDALLKNALLDDVYMMLEADVSQGHLNNDSSSSKLIPIMAHPPHKTSDISLESWIDRVIAANEEGRKVGIKLDFKYLGIVISSLEILRKKSSSLKFPLWLNADILQGPGGAMNATVDADIFLSLCTEFFPDAKLSLGWTTGYLEGEEQRYSTEMVDEMVDTLNRNNIVQPVTFPVRAAFVGNSWDALETLFLKKPDSTFTVWTASSDNVNLKALASFLNGIGENNVYLDLPAEDVIQVEKYLEEMEAQVPVGKEQQSGSAEAPAVETPSENASKSPVSHSQFVLVAAVVLCILASVSARIRRLRLFIGLHLWSLTPVHPATHS